MTDAVFNVILPALQNQTYTPISLTANQSNALADFEDQPPEQDFIKGSQLSLSLVRRISESTLLEDTIDALSNDMPVLFGFTVFLALESQEVAETGILPLPTEGEQPLGGHAVIAVGHNDDKQMILVRNQWGADWGLEGYFWMPYEYYANLVSEAYVIDDLAA
ncbi:C1 family peptidase [Alicyclobacillus fastidiosus]|uniref:C1 family peptidase n=1 Tax=Alicyclobacillus fastidiosus TaxID=392011 RepID=A0ABY6ZLH4_9BACL|nr:C1 family peptidase [Alicyclobacillus fastidiosus]WAH42971.1 C1 family peptidase [Alicyclobacillus fastidiosus]GMA64938.1 hypothetical protein GCM10025859_53780 [Alicyclobacillus fastidiosus]